MLYSCLCCFGFVLGRIYLGWLRVVDLVIVLCFDCLIGGADLWVGFCGKVLGLLFDWWLVVGMVFGTLI